MGHERNGGWRRQGGAGHAAAHVIPRRVGAVFAGRARIRVTLVDVRITVLTRPTRITGLVHWASTTVIGD